MDDYIRFIIASLSDIFGMLLSWEIVSGVSVGAIIIVSILTCILLGGLLNVVKH